jgi:AraC family transcriptional regulator, arabinose operon regulatory protein
MDAGEEGMDCMATELEYRAVMKRLETVHRPVAAVMASDFSRGPGYTNWRPRGSGDWLLIYTQAGAGNIVLPSGRSRVLGEGEALLYSPEAPQDYATAGQAGHWRLLWAHFRPRPSWRAWIRWPQAAAGVGWITLPPGEVRESFRAALQRTVAALKRPHGDAPEFAMNALEEALLWAQQATDESGHGRLDERVRRAMTHLAEHSAEPFRLEAVARACGLSPSRLSHLFKAQTGQTLQRYSEELRMRLAQQLMAHSGLPVGEVAAAIGFEDPFYFAKRFRKFARCSPSEYRQRRARG